MSGTQQEIWEDTSFAIWAKDKVHRVSGWLEESEWSEEHRSRVGIDRFDDMPVEFSMMGWKAKPGDMVYFSFGWDKKYEEWEIVGVERDYPAKIFPWRSFVRDRKHRQRVESLKQIELSVLALRRAVASFEGESTSMTPRATCNLQETKTIVKQIDRLTEIYDRVFKQCYSEKDLLNWFDRMHRRSSE